MTVLVQVDLMLQLDRLKRMRLQTLGSAQLTRTAVQSKKKVTTALEDSPQAKPVRLHTQQISSTGALWQLLQGSELSWSQRITNQQKIGGRLAPDPHRSVPIDQIIATSRAIIAGIISEIKVVEMGFKNHNRPVDLIRGLGTAVIRPFGLEVRIRGLDGVIPSFWSLWPFYGTGPFGGEASTITHGINHWPRGSREQPQTPSLMWLG